MSTENEQPQFVVETTRAFNGFASVARQKLEELCKATALSAVKLRVASDALDGLSLPFRIEDDIKAAIREIEHNLVCNINSLDALRDHAKGVVDIVKGEAAEYQSAWFSQLDEFGQLNDEWRRRYERANTERQLAINQKSQLEQRLVRLSEHSQSHPEFRQRVWDTCNGLCFYCDVKLIWSKDDVGPDGDARHVFHTDHIVSKNSGGPDHIHNFVASCASCNMAKADKSFVEFYRSRRRPDLRVVSRSDVVASVGDSAQAPNSTPPLANAVF